MAREEVMIAAVGTLLLGACHPAEIAPHDAGAAAIARGRDAARRLGCGACHAMPDSAWPKGRVGPALDGFGDRAMIAGQLPNDPVRLAAFVRDAPALVPGTAMPAIPMRDEDARDIAAWLQSLHEQ
ncbi:c-type cytochrome [Sphingopyxis flava]|uniref:Cytochrome c n=1 Tax=Sphingopyxis flava TaxID=1507287 RepID=A0A1T5BEU1_9SPHN|nr:c-type cytochrome [Sphingopyxis flava]SKB45665.1 Cytochrome c [Sphingopyxis flava]